MAPRKDAGKLSAQERLARLSGAARPASEHQPGDANPGVDTLGPLPPHVTPHVTEHVTGDVPEDVTSHVTEYDAGHVTSDVTQHVTSHVTDYTSQYVAGGVASDTATHVTEERFGGVGEGLTSRIRGRWTPEQLHYLKAEAKARKATAGDIIRHALAWYLVHGHPEPAVRSSTPSPDLLVKRETGLLVFDFLSTPTQASAIKKAAGAPGQEAAWMRKALDAFKERGPWSQTV